MMGVVVHASVASTQVKEPEGQKFRVILGYIVALRSSLATWDPVRRGTEREKDTERAFSTVFVPDTQIISITGFLSTESCFR